LGEPAIFGRTREIKVPQAGKAGMDAPTVFSQCPPHLRREAADRCFVAMSASAVLASSTRSR
jgi:hypothetical protein